MFKSVQRAVQGEERELSNYKSSAIALVASLRLAVFNSVWIKESDKFELFLVIIMRATDSRVASVFHALGSKDKIQLAVDTFGTVRKHADVKKITWWRLSN